MTTMPAITATYLGVLGLLFAFLGLRVARFRRGNKIVFGDGDDRYLRSAIRAHANFAEYVPIIVIMNALLEMGGAASVQMHVLLGTLTVSRVLHPFGIHANPRQNYERYIARAREAQLSGDVVEMENCYQHAEHYFRVLRGEGHERRG